MKATVGLMALTVVGVAVAAFAVRTTTIAADTSVFAFRAVIPGVAVDAGAVEASGSVVATHLSARIDGGLAVTGEVVNDGPTAVSNVRVRVWYATSSATVSKETESMVRVISRGESGPFRVTFPGITAVEGSVTAEVLEFEDSVTEPPAASVSVTGVSPFQIGPPDQKTGVIPYSTEVEQIRGIVTNTSSFARSDLEVVLAAYDGAGIVAFVTTSSMVAAPFQNPGESPVLLPGTTGTFVAAIPIGRLLEISGTVTWRGYLNSTTLP